MVEALISRGDARLAPLFEALHASGVRLEAWGECFNPGIYEEWLTQARRACREPPRAAQDFERRCRGILSLQGLTKSFLLSELEESGSGEEDGELLRVLRRMRHVVRAFVHQERPASAEKATAFQPLGGRPEDEARNGANQGDASFTTVTIRYAKAGQARYIGHLDTVDILLRAVRSAGISLKMHGKYHPKPRISLSAALPVGIESACEMMEMEAEGSDTVDAALIARINAHLPGGMRVLGVVIGPMPVGCGHFSYLLVGEKGLEGEVTKIKDRGARALYMSPGPHIKDLWLSGNFSRIVKVGNRRIDAIRADHQRNLQ